ncbi:MAG: penicillin-binding protein activator, partial [Bdellovibrionales bacterium]|nr:penicillin-binding protein activator [Bdellovibrionales bacterium]
TQPGMNQQSQFDLESAKHASKVYRRRYPWEAFPLFHDLNGKPLDEFNVLKGDELLEAGAYQDALSSYQKALGRQAEASVDEAIVIRIASTELALGNVQQSLDALSSYFTKSGVSVDQVGPAFSLLFGYVYAAKSDINQSFAWFSRSYQLADGYGGIADAASDGVRRVLRSLPVDSYEQVRIHWMADNFVNGLFGKESKRRAQGGLVEVAFLEQIQKDMQPEELPSYERLEGVIGVLLPLTGKFATIGLQTKQGIELALEAKDGQSGLKVQYADTQGDPATAAAQVRRLHAAGVKMYIGPLLRDTSIAAMNAFQPSSGNMLILSKHEDMMPQPGVFRLGPTMESQIDSLLESGEQMLSLKRYALIYPDDVVGQSAAEIFRRQVASRGLDLVYEVGYTKDDTSRFGQIGYELEQQAVDAVFFPDTIQLAQRFLTSISPKLRRTVRILGTAKWDRPAEIKRSQELLLGAVYVSPFFVASSNPYISQFESSYRTRFRQSPSFLSAQGFDAATIVMAALGREQQRGVPFNQALHSIDVYEGLTGMIRVGSASNLMRKFKVVEVGYNGPHEIGSDGRAQLDLRSSTSPALP